LFLKAKQKSSKPIKASKICVDWRQRFRLFPNYFGRVIVVAWLNREKNPREVATVTTAKIGDAQNAVSTKQTPQKRVYVNCNSKHHMTIL